MGAVLVILSLAHANKTTFRSEMALLSPKEPLQRSVRFMGLPCNYRIATTQTLFTLQEATCILPRTTRILI